MYELLTSQEFWASASAVLVAVLGYFARKSHKLESANEELVDKNVKLARFILNDFSMYNELGTIIDDIFAATSAERFLLFTAVNGSTDFNRVSALYDRDLQKPGEAVRRYANLLVDEYYRRMLKSAEMDGPFQFLTAEARDCLLKKIYEAEGVTEAKIIFLRRIPMLDGNDRLFFCSVATRAAEGYSDKERLLIRNYAGGLQAIMQKWF